MAKKSETEASRKAASNLSPYTEQQQQRREDGFPASVPNESPYLKFLEPLWGRTPRQVWGQNEEFIIGEIINPEGTSEDLYNSSRVGIWNAATGKLVFKRMGAVSICWNPDYSQIGVWYEYLDPTVSVASTRSNFLWEFERYSWETRKIISSCKISNDGILWSIYADFPKKYKGAIARLYAGDESGGESIYILCDDQVGDRELSGKEMEPLRKSGSFNLKKFWEDIRNPESVAIKPVLPEVTGERKEALVREIETIFNHNSYKQFTYQEITSGFKDLTKLIDMIALNDWPMPKIVNHVTPQWVFTWKNPNKKRVAVRVACKWTKTTLEMTHQSNGERVCEEFNENNLKRLLEILENLEV